MLTHILQSALCFGVDLAFAFPAVVLAKRQSPASGIRNNVMVHGALEERSTRKMGTAMLDKAAKKPLHARISA